MALWQSLEEEVMLRQSAFSPEVLVQIFYIFNMALRADFDLLKSLERQILFHKAHLTVHQVADLYYSAALRDYQSDKLFSSLLPTLEKHFSKLSPSQLLQTVYSQAHMKQSEYYLFQDIEPILQMYLESGEYSPDDVCLLAYSVSRLDFSTDLSSDLVRILSEESLETLCAGSAQSVVLLLQFLDHV